MYLFSHIFCLMSSLTCAPSGLIPQKKASLCTPALGGDGGRLPEGGETTPWEPGSSCVNKALKAGTKACAPPPAPQAPAKSNSPLTAEDGGGGGTTGGMAADTTEESDAGTGGRKAGTEEGATKTVVATGATEDAGTPDGWSA